MNATTVKSLVNALGLTELPAVKKLMFSNASGNVAEGCENEMDLLKEDRFEWSKLGTGQEIFTRACGISSYFRRARANGYSCGNRRRLLEKERSSYWAQFKSGLLSATAVAQLDNNLSEFLDLQGKVPLNDRDYLDKVCGVSKLTEGIKDLPFRLLKVIFRQNYR